MTYIIEQKIKGHVYFYEVESYWDSEKQQARQRRKYLGKKDPVTNDVTTPRKLPTVSSAYEYGHLYLLKELASKIGLKESVEHAFGEETANAILSVAYFNVLEGKSLYLYESWSEDFPDATHLTSQSISKLLQKIGSDDGGSSRFFQAWGAKQNPIKGVWLDITSISSYSEQNSWAEWGYNRDRESLPQINLGVLLGTSTQLPFFYQLYPGSIADVSTLHNITLRAKDFGFDIETWVMDRGFFSASNLEHLEEKRYKFITAMPSTTKESQRILAKSQSALRSPIKSFCLGKEVLFSHETTCNIGSKKFRACVYSSEKRRAQETENFIRRLDALEQLAKGHCFVNIDEAKEWISRQWKGSVHFYDVSLSNKGDLILKRKRNALSFRMNRLGKMVIVTNRKDLTLREVLEHYRNKDKVEKVYDNLKNSLNEERLRVHTDTTMHGKMFITFLSLILQTAINNKLRSSSLDKKYTIPQLWMELRKIRRFTRSQRSTDFLSEISKKQKDIFSQLDIPTPKL